MAAFFSDSDEDKAVEELLSQAMDATVLDQVSAINCAGFNHSGLPSHLESRFARLKSLPSATPKPSSLSTRSLRATDLKKIDSPIDARIPDSVQGNSPVLKEKCEGESKNCSPHADGVSISDFKKNPNFEIGGKGGKKLDTPDSSEGFSSRSVSPPVKSGCFMCSPKKVFQKKKRENRGFDLGANWGKNGDLLSDLSSFSVHSQKKMIREAMEEEERICREAEKIVKWAKQASARMDVSGIEEDVLSGDDENPEFH